MSGNKDTSVQSDENGDVEVTKGEFRRLRRNGAFLVVTLNELA